VLLAQGKQKKFTAPTVKCVASSSLFGFDGESVIYIQQEEGHCAWLRRTVNWVVLGLHQQGNAERQVQRASNERIAKSLKLFAFLTFFILPFRMEKPAAAKPRSSPRAFPSSPKSNF
jgi:hypothetical protein